MRFAPETRVAYVDNDPIVLVHARALLSSHRLGRTAVVQADVRDPEAILAHRQVRSMIDFDRPLAVMLASVLQFVPDRGGPVTPDLDLIWMYGAVGRKL